MIVWDSQAILLDSVAAHVSVGFVLDVTLSRRVAGAACQFFGQGLWTCDDILGRPIGTPNGSLTANLPWAVAPPVIGTAFDNTVAANLDMFFTQTAATGSMTVTQYIVSVF